MPRSSAKRVVVEREPTPDNPRPRDMAIKRAANDNFHAANDNQPRRDATYHPTVDEIFGASYAEQGLQPTYKTQVDRRAGNDESPAGPTSKYRGRFEQGPKGRDVTSRTKVEVGKKRSPGGKLTKLVTKNPTAKVALKVIGKGKAQLANRLIYPWAWPAYASFQVPLALCSIVFFALSSAFEEVKSWFGSNPVSEFLLDGVSWVVDSLGEASVYLFGFDITLIADPNMGLLLCVGGVVLISLTTLLVMSLIYVFLGIPLLRQGTALKIPTFICALFFPIIPVLNLVPWFAVWAWAVRRGEGKLS